MRNEDVRPIVERLAARRGGWRLAFAPRPRAISKCVRLVDGLLRHEELIAGAKICHVVVARRSPAARLQRPDFDGAIGVAEIPIRERAERVAGLHAIEIEAARRDVPAAAQRTDATAA